MRGSVLVLTTSLFVAVGANVVFQVNISPPKYIIRDGKTEIVQSKAEVDCSPRELCNSELKQDRFILRTDTQVMKDLVETTSNCKGTSARIEALPRPTAMSSWKVFKEEVKSSRRKRRKDRKSKTSTTTTTTTTSTTAAATTITTTTTSTTTEEPSVETTSIEKNGNFNSGRETVHFTEKLGNTYESSTEKQIVPDWEVSNGEDTTAKHASEEDTPSPDGVETTPTDETSSTTTTRSKSSWWGW